jgi:tetratricopeptide (TPR) repeat protein
MERDVARIEWGSRAEPDSHAFTGAGRWRCAQRPLSSAAAVPRPAKRWVSGGVVALCVAGVVAVLLLGKAETHLPENITDDTIVATLGSTAVPYPAELREAAARVREAPDDLPAAIRAARQYLDYGHTIGDARFVGAALGALEPWLGERAGPEVLNLAASARQYMHDFDSALSLLDRVMAIDPLNAQALLSRANIQIVKGRFAEASADCLKLAQARRGDLAILCDTTARALTSEAPQAYARLDGLVSIGAMDPALDGYAQSLLAEIARFQDWPDKARAKFEAARAADPEDLRTLMIFADFELAQGRSRQALELMRNAPATDSIMVRQAIACKAAGDEAELARLKLALRGRFDAAAAAGEAAHAREAARYWLEVEQDAQAALSAAEANWKVQRELEDALLLVASAAATGRVEAAQPVEKWAAEQGVTAPVYLSALAHAKRQSRDGE